MRCCSLLSKARRHSALKPTFSTVLTDRMTNQPTANQSNANKEKEKENQRDDNTEIAYKDAGHCSRNTHNLLLGLTVMGTYEKKHSGDAMMRAQVEEILEQNKPLFCFYAHSLTLQIPTCFTEWLELQLRLVLLLKKRKGPIYAAAKITTRKPWCKYSEIIFPWDVLGLLLSLLCHCKHFGMFLHSCVFCQKKPAESRSVLFLSAICHIDLNLDMNLFTFQ